MKKFSVIVMAVLYVAAGVNHFVHPQTYLPIIPSFIPWPELTNYISGLLEILFGLMLFFPKTRNLGAWCLVVLLILIFPANIKMAIDWQRTNHPNLLLAYLRLPLQPLLVWWALIYTNWYEEKRSNAGKEIKVPIQS